MARRPLALAAVLLVLAGCNPVVYVPAPIPAAPQRAGLHVGVGGNLAGAQGAALVELAPVEGVSVYARGLYANTTEEDAEDASTGAAYTHRGGDVGVAVAWPLSPQMTLDMGAALGRDRVEGTDFGFDIGCCSGSYHPFTGRTERVAGHAGLFFHRSVPTEGRARIGPAVRLTRVVVYADERAGASAEPDAAGVFLEPALRLGSTAGPVELHAQAGVSVPLAGDLLDRYAAVPLLWGGTAAFRLGP